MVGETINHYRIIEQLGAGGMGVVYRAEDVRLGRMVALKFLPAELSRDDAAASRFEREARTASSLNHPNICTIYAIEEFEGRRFIAMELLEGRPLSEAIAQPLPVDAAIEYGAQIADALDAAHAQGILHRDIKPANIFVTRRGHIKVLDFGLAKLSAAAGASGADLHETIADTAVSMPGMALGTVAYMSPEQARGEELDGRSDLFSCGIVLYEMVTGRQAFHGRTSAVVFDNILNHTPAPPTLLKGDVPPELERIITRALEKNREFRYQTASDLRSDLQRLRRDRDSGRVPAALSGSTAAITSSAAVPRAEHGTDEGPPALDAAGASAAPALPAAVPMYAAPARAPIETRAMARGALVTLLVVVLVLAAGVLVRRDLVNPAQPDPETAPARSPEPTLPPAPPPAATSDSTQAVTPAAGPAPAPSTAPAAERTGSRSSRAKEHAGSAGEAAVAPELKPASPVDQGPTLLGVARAKVAAKLYDQAFADLQMLVSSHATSASAPDAYLLMGSIRELQSRPDDARASYVELRSRHAASEASAEGTVRLAQLTLQTRRPDRVDAARQLLMDVPARHAGSPWAARALALQAALEDREKMKARDPVLGTTAPASLATNRTLTERYPTASEAELGFWHLALAYDDLERYDMAARALSDLATHFPSTRYDAWWRAAELYERRLKDKAAAAAAYARVPQSSPNYKAAQKKLR
jgi:TolA-binding protein/predicted Ser/Thr protein kinase